MTRDRNTAVVAMLSVRNGARALEFYKAAFGASELFRIDNDAGEVVAQLSVGGALSVRVATSLLNTSTSAPSLSAAGRFACS